MLRIASEEYMSCQDLEAVKQELLSGILEMVADTKNKDECASCEKACPLAGKKPKEGTDLKIPAGCVVTPGPETPQ